MLQGVDELTGIADVLLGCLQPCLGSLQGRGTNLGEPDALRWTALLTFKDFQVAHTLQSAIPGGDWQCEVLWRLVLGPYGSWSSSSTDSVLFGVK